MKNIILMLLLLLPLSAHTKEPTLEATLEFIQNKFITESPFIFYKYDSGELSETISSKTTYSFESNLTTGRITFEYTKTYITSGNTEHHKYEFFLKDLDPSSIELIEHGQLQIRLNTTYNKKTIITLSTLQNSELKLSSASLFFPEQKRELATRISKAFKHAITLAGGKEEAF